MRKSRVTNYFFFFITKAGTRHMNTLYIYIYIYVYTTAYENQDLFTNFTAEKTIVIDAEVVGAWENMVRNKCK